VARYLVLDWDHQQLTVVAATVKQGRVRLEQAIAWEAPHSPNPAEAEKLGAYLRERLQQAGIASAPVLICLGRDRVILKELRHPAVPAADEPAIVRFQAIKELNDPPDEVIIDYVSREGAASSGERRSLAVVLRRELLNAYQALCKAAGLKLAGVCPRPFGAVWCAKSAGAHDTVAILTATEQWAEFCVVKGETLLLARSVALPSGSDALLGEIRRNLAVFAGQAPQEPVRAVYIADGSKLGQLRERLQDKLAIPVHPLEPLTGLTTQPDRPGRFAGSVGLLQALAARGSLPIDFTKPREPKVAANPQHRRAALAAGLIAALLVAGIAFGYTTLAGKSREMENLVLQKAQLDQQLTSLREDEKRAKAVADWVNTEVVWLDELYDLADRVPDINAIHITGITADPLPPNPNEKHVARMTLQGVMTYEPKAVNTLMDRLVGDGYYQVDPKDVGRNTGPDRTKFAQQFTAKVAILPRPPDKYVRRLPPPPPRRPEAAPAGNDLFDLQGMFGGGRP
jgi:hypothetical protein